MTRISQDKQSSPLKMIFAFPAVLALASLAQSGGSGNDPLLNSVQSLASRCIYDKIRAKGDPTSKDLVRDDLRQIHQDNQRATSIHQNNLKYFFELTNKKENAELLTSLGITVYKDQAEFNRLMTVHTNAAQFNKNTTFVDNNYDIRKARSEDIESPSDIATEYLKIIKILLPEDGHLEFKKDDLINAVENLTKGSNDSIVQVGLFNQGSKEALLFSPKERELIEKVIKDFLDRSQDETLDLVKIVSGIHEGSRDISFELKTIGRFLEAARLINPSI